MKTKDAKKLEKDGKMLVFPERFLMHKIGRSKNRPQTPIVTFSQNFWFYEWVLLRFARDTVVLYFFRNSRLHKFNHTMRKALQWLAWSTNFWTGQGWSHILLFWGRFFYTHWDYVCQFSRKNLPWNVWEKVPNFGYYISQKSRQRFFLENHHT